MNHTNIEQLTENCTVKIFVSGSKNGHGTGFFIAPGYLITCAHVLNLNTSSKISILTRDRKSLSAKLTYSFAPELDLAILQANLEFANSCVYLDDEISSRDLCFSFGYTDSSEGNPDGDPVTLECEGLAGKERTVVKLKGGQVRPGMSGAPLLNQRTGKVCGVINRSRNRQNDLGGEALLIRAIFEKFPVLKEAHDYFHKSNNDWSIYLKDNVRPFPSDWERLDRKEKRWSSYLQALLFLISVLFKWMILGLKAPRAFPIETVSILFRHTLAGDLGQEINRQRKELARNVNRLDIEAGGQAQIINQLESKASLLSELIKILIPESPNLASSSRLLWAVELI